MVAKGSNQARGGPRADPDSLLDENIDLKRKLLELKLKTQVGMPAIPQGQVC